MKPIIQYLLLTLIKATIISMVHVKQGKDRKNTKIDFFKSYPESKSCRRPEAVLDSIENAEYYEFRVTSTMKNATPPFTRQATRPIDHMVCKNYPGYSARFYGTTSPLLYPPW